MSDNPLGFKTVKEAEEYADQMEQLSNQAYHAGLDGVARIATEHQIEAMEVAKNLSESQNEKSD